MKSSGAVLIQAGNEKAKAYAPKAKDAWDSVQCISARDLDCLSKTTWAKDAKGKISSFANGKPRFDPNRLDPRQYIGKWTGIDPNSIEGKSNAIVTQISQLPAVQAIPLMKNKWVLSWTISKTSEIGYGKPEVVLTYVGPNPSFTSGVSYSHSEVAPSWTSEEGGVATKRPNLYACNLAGINRVVRVTKQGNGCEAIYKREDGKEDIVWHSDHYPGVCARKAAQFVTRMRSKRIQCTAS